MATKPGTIDYILEQSAGAGAVTAKKMFGEYGLYLAGTFFGMVCDDQLFLKPTAAGRALLTTQVREAAPYPGAKPCFSSRPTCWRMPIGWPNSFA